MTSVIDTILNTPPIPLIYPHDRLLRADIRRGWRERIHSLAALGWRGGVRANSLAPCLSCPCSRDVCCSSLSIRSEQLGSTQARAARFFPTLLPPYSLFLLPLPVTCTAAPHPVSPLLSLALAALALSLLMHRFEEVVCTVRPYGSSGWEPPPAGVDLRRQSPFRRVSSFHITTIWLIDNSNSARRG